MILTAYAFKDTALGAFMHPTYDDRPAENIAVGHTRAIMTCKDKGIYQHKQLFKIGTYDDIKGLLVACEPELVLDCDQVLAQLGISQVAEIKKDEETKN